MASIKESVRAYESWMRKELGRELVEKDLARKHEKLAESPFVFLRGTFWRWAQTTADVPSRNNLRRRHARPVIGHIWAWCAAAAQPAILHWESEF